MFKIKNNYKEWYQPNGSFVLRNPLMPVDFFFKWQAEINPDTELSKEVLRKRLRDFYLQPIAQEALYIGSPDLHGQMLLWLENKIDKADKKERTELSLVKYMIRMCARCTPYGLFASCSSGNFGDHSDIQLPDKKSLKRYGRLDMDYVGQVLSHLLNKPEIADQLCFFPNSSLYPLGDNYRYVEHRFAKETGRSYHLVEIVQSDYLAKILLAAKNGCTPGALASTIASDAISIDESSAFIQELIQSQVLVSDLEPNVTGQEFFLVLINKLKSLQHTEQYVTRFEKVLREFEQIKSGAEDSKDKFYPQIAAHLQELEVPFHLKTLIQVDSYRPVMNCTLNKKVAEDCLYGASLLHLLSPAGLGTSSFSGFKNAFTKRYEMQWMPLVEVLDTETGIGYGKFATTGMDESPLIDKLPIADNRNSSVNQMPDAESFKWELYQEAILQYKTEVIVGDKTIEEFSGKEADSANLPDSVSLMLKINAVSASDMDNGNYTISMRLPAGPSGGNLLGRFCHLHPEIEALTRTALQNEEAHLPDCIFAEIVHLPESRAGNILMRPVLRKYEIPYLCGSTVDKEFQIPVTDLLVGIENNRVVLRSIRLNKQVIPRLTNAHNFSMTNLPVYQFLCDLQFQEVKYTGWTWGILENRPFLPRVSYGKYIFSKATWLLSKDEVKDGEKKNDHELQILFSEIAERKNLPRYVLLSQGDNELLLDLKNIFCLKLLLTEVIKYERIKLTETLDLPEQCWINSPDGHHAAEFIFTFNKNTSLPVVTPPLLNYEEGKNIQRYFQVGSEWLYAKIYCGTKTAEKILSEILNPFTQELLSAGVIDKYFFIRYHDTGNHIRIRFHHSSSTDFWKEVIGRLQELLQPLMNDHSVYNLQFETYQREVERYGFDTMESSENIFHFHSVAILDFISMLEGDEGEQYRWRVALKALDLFLDDFGYSAVRKRDLLKVLHESFSKEFNISTPQRRKLSERFSSNKKTIQDLLGEGWKTDENLAKAIGVFEINDRAYRNAIGDILVAATIKASARQLDYLMSSYLHMFINRLFISSQRKVELVIYDYLLRYYESKIARESKQAATSVYAEIIHKNFPAG